MNDPRGTGLPPAVLSARPVRIGDCEVYRGDWVFGPLDGVVAAPAELARGRSIREVFAEYRIR